MSNSIHWENIADRTYRLKIPNGYLYRYSDRHDQMMVYVPDEIKSKVTKRKKK